MELTRALRPRRTLGAVLLVMAFAGPAHAQTAAAKAGARAAAQQGLSAFAEKRYSDALDMFTRAESLMHAPTHLLMMARAQVALGKLVAARESYTALSRETLDAKAPTAFKEAQADGAKELQALEPRVPTIEVKVSDASAKNVVITMDGAPLPAALVGIPHPVDPGKHVLEAKGDDVSSVEKSVQVDEGARVAVVLELRSAPGTKGATPAGGGAGAAAGAGAGTGPDTGAPPSGTMRIAGFVGIGLGVVGVGLGAVFAGLGFSKRGEANDAYDACAGGCVTGSAAAENVTSLDDDANSKQTIGLIGLIAGGAFAATGITLLVLSPKAEKTETGLWIGPGRAGIAGTF